MKQYVSTAGHDKQSLYLFVLPFCDVSNIVTIKRTFNFTYQPQEDTGSAEEQPASNKADAYTIVKRGWLASSFLFIIGMPHA